MSHLSDRGLRSPCVRGNENACVRFIRPGGIVILTLLMGFITQGVLAVDPTTMTPASDAPAVTIGPCQIEEGDSVTVSVYNLTDGSRFSIRIASAIDLDGQQDFFLKATNLRIPFSLDSSRIHIRAEPVTQAGIKATFGWFPISMAVLADGGIAELTQGIGNIASGTTVSSVKVFGTAEADAATADLLLEIGGITSSVDVASLTFGLEGVTNGSVLVEVSVDDLDLARQEITIGAGSSQDSPLPAAAFIASPVSGAAPLAVAFTDTSTGSPTSWTWDLGDGAVSTEQHPAHIYTVPGTYSVTLTTGNAAGTDTVTRTDLITVTSPLAVSFPTASPGLIAVDTDGAPAWGESSRLGVTVTGGSGIETVTVNLSAIGGPVSMPMMQAEDGHWTVQIAATAASPHENGTYRSVGLGVTVMEKSGAVNSSVAVPLTVVRNGDLSGDGRVTLYDATCLARSLLGVSGYAFGASPAAEVTGDGVLTLADAMYLAKHTLGIPGFETLH